MTYNIIIRKALYSDIDNLYTLANDPVVRNLSFNTEIISYKEHKLWFINTLKENKRYLYIFEEESGNFIGQINFLKTGNKNFIISISIKKEYRGRGLGHLLLNKAIKRIRIDDYEVKKIIAYIKKENIVSKKIFERAGFELIDNNYLYEAQKAIIMEYRYNKTLIVAELSANHNNSINTAKKTIEAAAESGADAIKIQTYTADTITINCDNDYFKIKQGTIWDGRTLYDLYKEAYTPWEWHDELKILAESLGLMFFSTPFDITAVDFLESKNVPMYKIASFEITDIPLIEYTASKGKPMIISTGIAEIQDLNDAIDACRRVGNNDITLLKCTSSYPAPVEQVNLLTMVDMKKNFNVKVGLSDHTLGKDVAVAAVALGAEIIEKHFIIDRKIGGPDASFSMEPTEFKSMVESIYNVEKALGTIDYNLSSTSLKNREIARSLFAVEDIKAGEKITKENVRSIRPGFGLKPKCLKDIIGKRVIKDIERGTPLNWNIIKS